MLMRPGRIVLFDGQTNGNGVNPACIDTFASGSELYGRGPTIA